ncbi:MAG: ATP-binding cassette domain-containing protein [Propionibacteriaceae bacterium]|nr:ATP-binding cassette domain-containing protein [Propionibacteriaceae bacterium]
MLHLDQIRKTYHAGNFTQAALDGVTLTLRDNEFVAVLGPSGSGKTTLLNIVGGLDHYDSGDLVIDQVSTSQYSDRDWDTYRNNRIGFVFQSYNLIPHQTVLANVELALTLSGVSKPERTTRAKQALEQVGLAEHIHKLPSQLSGGQMQRVAIARALINDPEILLADEPTGALDSKTSVQVMNLLQGISRDRLVVMVTHNPELAEQYATRVVSLKDGQVVADTDPYTPTTTRRRAKPVRRTSMSFFTAIALSFTNLMTKKGRTLMTSFAGSIGIIGIAAILAIANGVNAYITSVEQNTLSLYPLTIQTQGLDLTSLVASATGGDSTAAAPTPASGNTAEVHETSMISRMFSRIGSNDLTSLKTYLDSDKSDIDDYVNAIEYAYNVNPQIYATDTTDGVRQVNPNSAFASLGFSSASSTSMLSSMGMSTDIFSPLPHDMNLITGQYDLVAGTWPTSADQCLLILTSSGGISDLVAYMMGLRDPKQLDQMIAEMADNKPIEVPTGSSTYTYAQLMGVDFTVVNAVDYYQYDPTYDVWTDRSGDQAWMTQAIANGAPLHIAGIVRPNDAATATMLRPGLYYTTDLVDRLMKEAAASPIVAQQLASPSVNVFSGETFATEAKNPTMSDFDFSSLIRVNQDALAGLFSPDLSGLNLSLPQLDLSAASAAIPSIAVPDLATMLASINIQISPEDLTTLLEGTIGDYLKFALTQWPDLNPDTWPQLALPTPTLPPPAASTTPTPSTPTPTPAPTPTAAPTPSTPTSTATPTPTTSATPTASASPSSSATLTPLQPPKPAQAGLTAARAETVSRSVSGTSTPARPTVTQQTGIAGNLEVIGTPKPSSASPTVTPPMLPAILPMGPDIAPTASPGATQASASSSPVGGDPDSTTTATPGQSASPSTLNPASKPTQAVADGPSTPGPTASTSSRNSSAASSSPTASATPTTSTSPTPTPKPSTTPSAQPTPTLPSLPTLDQVITSFSTWFNRPEVQARFVQRLASAINTDALEQELSRTLTGYMEQVMTSMMTSMMSTLQTQLSAALQATMSQMGTTMSSAMNMDPSKFSEVFTFTMDPSQLTSVLMTMMNSQTHSLDSNLKQLGYATAGTPSSISIYPKDFAAKQRVLTILDSYNDSMTATGQDDKVITYTDIVGTLMSSVTDIISKVSAVLVAFVSISLVVSSIMIGVITYISVLERKKEIGILRALGASKRDIANVFNAETLIVGFVAGLMGVLFTVGLAQIANPIVGSLYNIDRIARLPFNAAAILILISMALTFLAGLIPSSAASRRDPVEALRSE